MLIASPRLYNQMVLDSVVASRRVMGESFFVVCCVWCVDLCVLAGLPPFEPNDNSALTDSDTDSEPQTVPSTTTQPQQHSKPTKKAIHHLSFEMYYETWKDLATSTDSNSGRGCGVGRIGRGGRSGELSTVIEA